MYIESLLLFQVEALNFFIEYFYIVQITVIENEIDNRTVHAPFVKFVGQPNTEIDDRNYMDPKNVINQIQ